ncbi:TonB-dependent receptor [Aureitalea sp. L0-47]|uniref:TonB-dependent receptor n=1 Tax=Aureitalea sp. L0-47 TaxID=2816962 RepID=UPI00223845FA|nr:TonB-dependent receptor [Aureitalea sp. L0-47]MCW5520541.1 TonB-dependent receptor [Aureitalea sp. L0-47]
MRLTLFLLLLVFSSTGIAQNCDNILSGRVTDQHDGTPLSGATLVLMDTDKASLSDIDGTYQFSDLCEGTYSIQVSHPECDPKVFSVKVPRRGGFNIELEHHVELLKQVTVVGTAYSTKSETLLENRINLATLEEFSGASFGDAINTLSGVSSLNTGNTVVKPMINGLHSSRVTIINNGVRLQDQEWGAEHAPTIDINTAGAITVLKGASALQYSGDAIGGVIISEPTRIPIKDTIYGKTILYGATNGRGGALTSSLTKSYGSGWYGTIQGTFKRFGDFEAPDYILSNTGLFERDGSLRVGYKQFDQGVEGYYSYFRNDIGILRASHLGGAQDQIAAISSERPLIIRDFTYDIGSPRQEVTHHVAQLSAFKRVNNLGKLSLSYNFQLNERFEFDVRRGDDEDTPAVDLELTTHHVALDLESNIKENLGVKVGVSGNFQNNFADPATGVRRLIPDYDQYRASVYGIADLGVNEKLNLEFGGRFDYTFMDAQKFYRTSFWESRGYDELFPELVVDTFGNQILTNPELDFANVSATAGLNYQMNENYIFYANYSLASRAPNASELFSEGLHHSASRIELGDLRFTSEVGHKIGLTLQKKTGVLRFTVNPYINLISDFIVIEPTGIQQTIRGNFQVWEYRQTSARLAGVDFDLNADLTENLEFEHQFSYINGSDTDLDVPLINMPPASTTNSLHYTFPNFYDLVLSVKSEYVFEQTEFPDNNFEVFLPETGTTELVDVSTPPDAYHLLGLKAQAGFHLGDGGSKLDVGLSVANLFDTNYRNYLNRLRFYADDLGRNLSLNIKISY